VNEFREICISGCSGFPHSPSRGDHGRESANKRGIQDGIFDDDQRQDTTCYVQIPENWPDNLYRGRK